jgi:hypothetical protein
MFFFLEMLVRHNSRLKSAVLYTLCSLAQGEGRSLLEKVLFSHLYSVLAVLLGFVLFGIGSAQCCGSKTIFFIQIRIPFSSQFLIRIRIPLDFQKFLDPVLDPTIIFTLSQYQGI